MARVDRVKRRLLRELVAENVHLRRGGWSPPRRRGWRRRVAVGLAMGALLPLGVLLSSQSAVELAAARLGGAPLAAAAVPAVVETASPPAPVAENGASPAVPAEPPAPAALHRPPRRIDPASLPLAVKKIVLDPGHGGSHSGAQGPGGLVEKELTLDLATRLGKLLEEASYEVLTTRTDDRAVSLDERALLANQAGADIFVSIHVNWIDNRSIRGVETYFLGPTEDPFITRLAAAENRGSGYSLADFRQLLEQIYLDVRNEESRRLAENVQRSLFRSLSRVNAGLEDRGVKTAPFLVLARTEMPAVLAEVSCLSNQREAELLAKPLYRQYIAEALFSGIRSYAERVEREGT